MGNVAEPELLEGGVRYAAFQEDNYSTGYEAEELGTTSNGDAFGISTGGGVQNQKANKKGERRDADGEAEVGGKGKPKGQGKKGGSKYKGSRQRGDRRKQVQDQLSRLNVTFADRQAALDQISEFYESLLQPIRELYVEHNNTRKKKNNGSSLVDTIMHNYHNRNQTYIKTNPRLTDRNARCQFHNQIRRVLNQRAILFSIDIEAWEINNQTVTEIGIAIHDPRRNGVYTIVPQFTKLHIRVLENMHRSNGKYVPDHAFNFVGEPTLILSMRDSVILIQSLFDYFFKVPGTSSDSGSGVCSGDDHLETFLVGHGLSGDIKWLSSIGIEFPPKYATLDTLQILKITHGNHQLSLAKALMKLDLPHAFLHNAGNDAYYTLLLCLKLLDPGVRTLYKLDLCLDEQAMMSEEERQLAKEEKQRKKQERKELREVKKLQQQLGLVELSDDKKDTGSADKKQKKLRKKQVQDYNVAPSVQCTVSDAVLYLFGGKPLPSDHVGEEENAEEVEVEVEARALAATYV